MALVLFSWLDDQQRAFTVALDCSLSETHAASAQVTDHQVEVGSNVTDHIRPMPLRLTIEGFITNTPIMMDALQKSGMNISAQTQSHTVFIPRTTAIGYPAPEVKFSTFTFADEFDRVRDAHIVLIDAMSHGRIMAVTTTLREYANMAATSLTVPRNSETGAALRFTIEFQELRFATTVTVAVPARRAKAKLGDKTPAAASAEEGAALESTLHRAILSPTL